jgi:hypothetical protein
MATTTSAVINCACLLLALTAPAWGQDALDTPAWRQGLRNARGTFNSTSATQFAGMVEHFSAAGVDTGYGFGWWDYLYAVMLEDDLDRATDADRKSEIAEQIRSKYREAIQSLHADMTTTAMHQYTHEGYSYPLSYMRLKPYLTADERTAWEDGLKRKAEYVLGWGPWGPSTRLDDTDMLVGHWGLVVNVDLALGTTYCTLQAANAEDGTSWVGCSVSEMQAQLDRCLDAAKGGVWVESEAYNLTTNRTLLMSAAIGGIDRYPKIKQHLLDLGEQYRWHHTPDLKDIVQWGDEEHPHQFTLHHRIPLYHVIAGLGGDPSGKLLHLAKALQPTPDSAFWISHADSLLTCDPARLPELPVVEHPVGVRQAANGLLIHRTPESVVSVFCPNNVIAGGWVDHQMTQWNLTWWHRGSWLVPSVTGYAPWSKNHNGSEGYGLQLCLDKRMLPATITPQGFRVEMETWGPHVWQYLYEPPPSFTRMRRRVVEFDGRGFTVEDDVDQVDPRTLPNYQNYGGSKSVIENALAPLEQFWHTSPGSIPKPNAGGFDWLAVGGTPMELKTDAPIRQTEQVLIGTNVGQWVGPSEEGGYLMRLGAEKRIVTRIGLAELVPPSTDVEVRGVIRGKTLTIELP